MPRDLLIAAGSDGITRAQRVPISALDLKPDLLGRTSVAMLIDRIELGIGPRITIIPGELVIRASTTRNKGRASGRPASTRKKDPA